MEDDWTWDYVILGQPMSKANGRRTVGRGKKSMSIKSEAAIDYVKYFKAQCLGKTLRPLLSGDVTVWLQIWYASRRPDLEPALIMDCLQEVAYKDDRQVKAQMVEWNLDPQNPRARIRVRPIQGNTKQGVSCLTTAQIWGTGIE